MTVPRYKVSICFLKISFSEHSSFLESEKIFLMFPLLNATRSSNTSVRVKALYTWSIFCVNYRNMCTNMSGASIHLQWEETSRVICKFAEQRSWVWSWPVQLNCKLMLRWNSVIYLSLWSAISIRVPQIIEVIVVSKGNLAEDTPRYRFMSASEIITENVIYVPVVEC